MGNTAPFFVRFIFQLFERPTVNWLNRANLCVAEVVAVACRHHFRYNHRNNLNGPPVGINQQPVLHALSSCGLGGKKKVKIFSLTVAIVRARPQICACHEKQR